MPTSTEHNTMSPFHRTAISHANPSLTRPSHRTAISHDNPSLTRTCGRGVRGDVGCAVLAARLVVDAGDSSDVSDSGVPALASGGEVGAAGEPAARSGDMNVNATSSVPAVPGHIA